MLEFSPIASSSSGCAYKLSGGGASAPLLLDAGVSLNRLQVALNHQVTQLAGCLLSHAHGDHVRAAKGLLTLGVHLYASRQTFDSLTEWRRTCHAVSPGEEFAVEDWRIKAFECVHDVAGTLGYVIGSPDGHQAVYLTDSSYSRYRFPGTTHWFVECNHSAEILRRNTLLGDIHAQRYKRVATTHMSLERLIDLLNANDLTTAEEIWLLHLSDANSDEAAFADAVRSATGVPTYVAPRGTI